MSEYMDPILYCYNVLWFSFLLGLAYIKDIVDFTINSMYYMVSKGLDPFCLFELQL